MEHLIRTQRYDDETSTLFDVTYCGLECVRTGEPDLRGPGESPVVEVCRDCAEAQAKDNEA